MSSISHHLFWLTLCSWFFSTSERPMHVRVGSFS